MRLRLSVIATLIACATCMSLPASAAAAECRPAAHLEAGTALVRAGLATPVATLHFDDQDVSAGTWQSIDSSEDSHVHKRPGAMRQVDITLGGTINASAKKMFDWINKATAGAHEPVEMTLGFSFKPPLARILPDRACRFENVLPVRYEPPAFDSTASGIRSERITLHLERARSGAPQQIPPVGSPPPAAGGNPLGDSNLQVAFDGLSERADGFAGGGVCIDWRDGLTTGESHCRAYTVTKVNWQSVRIERDYVSGERDWESWFETAQPGILARKNITIWLVGSDGQAIRTYNYFDAFPIRYDVIDVDSRAGSSSIKEVLELDYERAEYR